MPESNKNELIILLDRCFECETIFPEKLDTDGFEEAQRYKHNHHVVPFSKGGRKTIPLCVKCHDKIHDASLVRMSYLTRGKQTNNLIYLAEHGQEILNEYKNGLSMNKICIKYNLRWKMVSKFLVSEGCILKRKLGYLNQDEQKKILEFYKPEMPMKFLIMELNLYRRTTKIVREFLIRMGIYKRFNGEFKKIYDFNPNFEEIKKLVISGMEDKEIAEKYNVPKYVFSTYKRRHHLCKDRFIDSKIDKNEFLKIFNEGFNLTEMKDYFGISYESVYKLIKKLGLVYKKKTNRFDRFEPKSQEEGSLHPI